MGNDIRIETHTLGGCLAAHVDNRPSVAERQRVARAAAVPADRKTPSMLEDPSKFREGVRSSKPVKRLGTEDDVDGLRTQPRGFGSSSHPRDIRVAYGCATHGFPRFDGHYANPLFAEQTRRDSGSRSHVCGDEPRGRPETIENHMNRFDRVGWTISDVVGCPIAESPDRVQVVTMCHSSRESL